VIKKTPKGIFPIALRLGQISEAIKIQNISYIPGAVIIEPPRDRALIKFEQKAQWGNH
jgi:hypothetical protein